MGKINGCIKCLFVFFNVLFAIVGCVLIFVAVKATDIAIQMSMFGDRLGWLWFIAIGIFGLSSLGIFAACSEKELFLKIFAGFMVLGMIVMLIFGTVMTVMRNQLKDTYQSEMTKLVEPLMKDERSRQMLESLQPTFQCCGLVSADDWGINIPSSCECNNMGGPFGVPDCKFKPLVSTGPAMIYSKSCGDFLFYVVDIVFKIIIGVLFGFAATALMGLLISILMIHQIKRNDSIGGPSFAMKGF